MVLVKHVFLIYALFVCTLSKSAPVGGTTTIKRGPCQVANNATGTIYVHFNPMLDQALDSDGGLNDRIESFQDAVEEWNVALGAVGALVKLEARIDYGSYASVKGDQICSDSINQGKVFKDIPISNLTGNLGSSAMQNTSGQGAGWISNSIVPNVDSGGGGGQLIPTDLLAMARPTMTGTGDLTASSITFYTHWGKKVDGGCDRIPFQYASPHSHSLDPDKYSYEAVALHELGHLMGLSHIDKKADGSPANGIMKSRLGKGEKPGVLGAEQLVLKSKYGAGGECLITPVQ